MSSLQGQLARAAACRRDARHSAIPDLIWGTWRTEDLLACNLTLGRHASLNAAFTFGPYNGATLCGSLMKRRSVRVMRCERHGIHRVGDVAERRVRGT